MQPDAEAILLEVLASYSDADKWVDAASHKLTKRRGQLRPISGFEDHILTLVSAIDQHRRETP